MAAGDDFTVEWVPVLITKATARQRGASVSDAVTRPHRRPIVPGVHAHRTDERPIAVPVWADDEWRRIRTLTEAIQIVCPDAVLSHVSAAQLHGLPVPARIRSSLIDITSARSQMRRPGFRGHRPQPLTAVRKHEVTVAHPLEVLRQLAGLLTIRELVDVVDALCGPWHGQAVTDPGTLTAQIPDWRRFPGRRTLEAAVRASRAGVGSPRETQLRLAIVDAGLPEPAVTAPVEIGGITYHPDLSYLRERIAIEYEGDHHRTQRRQWNLDIRRAQAFANAGWVYLRVTRDTVMQEFLSELARHLHDRWRGQDRRQ